MLQSPGLARSSPRDLGPDCAAMDAETAGEFVNADPSCAGCSHSVHFLVREPCSTSFLWFHRRPDQRVVGPVLGLRILADALIPRGDHPLNPLSPVPAMLHCVHRNGGPPGGGPFCFQPTLGMQPGSSWSTTSTGSRCIAPVPGAIARSQIPALPRLRHATQAGGGT